MASSSKSTRKVRGNGMKDLKPAIDVSAGAIPAEALEHAFPQLKLAIQPPYAPAEAKSVAAIPAEPGWLYEPKWDGFRCLAFRSGDEVVLQSKAGQPLGRYFPEIVEGLLELPVRNFVLDGEIVIFENSAADSDSRSDEAQSRKRKAKSTVAPSRETLEDFTQGLDFDALLQRIHPAASRIKKLAAETPSTYLVFDLLVNERGKRLTDDPLSARRMALQHFAENFRGNDRVYLSPATSDFSTAQRWMQQGAASGLDGVVAKCMDCEYTSGERTGMVKIKRIRTADCVVGGFRWAQKGGEVGSLLLGLYNEAGQLDHVGFSSSFSREDRKKLKGIVTPLIAKSGEAGFTGKAPGGPSRWTTPDRNTEWFPLQHKLVGEFQFDHYSGGRFRHGTKFLRWRPEKKPEQCGKDQVEVRRRAKRKV
jgi:ATP-dependent DNA ligase